MVEILSVEKMGGFPATGLEVDKDTAKMKDGLECEVHRGTIRVLELQRQVWPRAQEFGEPLVCVLAFEESEERAMTTSLVVGQPSPHCDCSFQSCWKREREPDTTGRRAPSEGKCGSWGVDMGG